MPTVDWSAIAVAVGVGLRVVLFGVFAGGGADGPGGAAATGLSSSIAVASPVNAFPRLTEGVYLQSQGQSPYAGDVYHGTPLLLALFTPLLGGVGGANSGSTSEQQLHLWLIRSVFIAADVLVALALKKLARYTLANPPPAGVDSVAAFPFLKTLPDIITAAYLLNAFTLLGCVALSTAVFAHAAIAFAMVAATSGMVFTTSALLALATYLEMYPVFLLIPAVVILTQEKRRNTATSENGGSNGNSNNSSGGGRAFDWSIVAVVITTYAVCLSGLLYLSYMFIGDWSFFFESYLFTLWVGDLTPNIGLFWYFFTEIFDRFRGLFLAIFHTHALAYVPPLTMRFGAREPLFLSYVLVAIWCVFKSYPVISDTSFALVLAMVHAPLTLPRMRRVIIPLAFLFLLCSHLASLMWFLWIYPGSGNANFLYFQTLLYVGCNAFFIIECIGAVRRLQAMASAIPATSVPTATAIPADTPTAASLPGPTALDPSTATTRAPAPSATAASSLRTRPNAAIAAANVGTD